MDASALVKLVVGEEESARLRAHLKGAPHLRCVASIIVRTEVGIAIARHGADAGRTIADDRAYLHVRDVPVTLTDVTADVARLAAELGANLGLRTLDAIHVATAAALGPRIDELVTYDGRMIDACARLSIPTASPGR